MSIKVYLHYDIPGSPEKTSKLSIPGSWASKRVSDVIGLFVKPYNEKNPDHAIDIENIHLETNEGSSIYSNIAVSEGLVDRGDYFIKAGAYLFVEKEKVKESRPRCRNYGCNKYYSEEDNHDEACEHHTGPPIFHDTAKFWSCCPGKKAFDFESFQAITGCNKSKHSTMDPSIAIGASPNATKPKEGVESAAPVLKSIEEYNATNQDATTAAESAVKTLSERKSSRKEDGTARCQRKGCQKVFTVDANHATACQYHKGQAIFHDAAKFWSCCADRKCYDFDDFLAVPGCERGYHDDGVIDL
jgi:hypothetical protein